MKRLLLLSLIVFLLSGFVNLGSALASDGTIDTSFVTGTGFDGPVNAIVKQSDGKIIVGGQFYNYNGTPSASIVRLNSDGSIDSSFTIGTGFNGAITALGITSNGKIIAAGTFDDYNSNYSKGVARINSDGTFDSTFVTGIGISGARNFYTINAMVVQSDDKVILVGRFNGYDGNTVADIVRINTDGSFDSSFLQGGGFDNETFSLAIQSDNKIIVGGTFNSYDSNTVANIVRLNSDGTYDASFSTGAGFSDRVSSIVVQSDNKILLAGPFTTFDGNSIPYLIRLNSNGSIDGSFNTSNNFDGTINSAVIQSNGKIIVGGVFNNYGSTAVSHGIAQLTSTGALDSTFSIGTGFDFTPLVMLLDSNNKLIVGGDFGQYNGSTAVDIIRLNADPVVIISSGGGGGGHHSSGFLPSLVQIPTPTTGINIPAVCMPLITGPIERGKKNNPEEVNKLVTFLNTHEGTNLIADGIYGRKDVEAIKNFQTKYYKDIFSPFLKNKVTGIVGYYTRFKINELNCLKK
jgi:uncharacterized delta-60 repeat protein